MQDRVTKCLGIVTQYNPLTIAPGALLVGNDCVNRRENILETRRGYKTYATLGSNVTQLLTYRSRVIVHRGTAFEYDNGSGTFAAYTGSYSAPTSYRVRGVEAFSNLYATTNLGVKVFSDITGTAARLAGAPRSLDPSYTLAGASGFLADTFQCAYRCLIQRTDANAVVVRGYPSQRLWVVNSAGASRNTILTIYLPSEATAGDVMQVYRTTQVSGVATDTSGDEMGLVYQYSLVAADITAGFISFTDSIVDELRGATIYTAPSQEGILQANERPPLASDIALHKSNYLFYGNTSTKQRLFITMVGTTGLSGKTITLGGVTYNFGATEITSGGGSPQAKVYATGVAASDIDNTARSLVRVINRYASNTTVYAYYLTGPSDLPGQILIEEKGVGAAAFTVQASDATIGGMFFPVPPTSPSTNTASTSSNQVQKNAVYYSKAQQPEHVPALNYLLVGSGNKEILRIVSLRDSTIVVKEEGVFRISGESPQSFTVVPVDLTVFCKSPDSVVVLANQVLMLSNQGVVSISESGVQVISHEIEPSLTPLLTVSGLASYTSACAYESERFYMLSTITLTTDTAATQTLIYNIFTRTWVKHSYPFLCAIVEPVADKLYFAKPSSAVLYRERKDFADSDYADPEYSITLTVLGTSSTVDFTSSTTPEVGWVISQGTSELVITSLLTLGGSSYRATLESGVPSDWTLTTATLYPSVGMEVEWQTWSAQNPDLLKQVWGAAILADDSLNDNTVSGLDLTFRTNFDSEVEAVSLSETRSGWGAPWGTISWGGGIDSVGYPTYVPKNKQYCTRLHFGVRHNYARQKLVIAGFALSYNMVSDRIGR